MVVLTPDRNMSPETFSEEIIDASGKHCLFDVLTVRVVDGDGRPNEVPTAGSSVMPCDLETTLIEWLGEACTESLLFLLLEWKNPANAESPIIDVNRFVDIEVDSSWSEATGIQRRRLQNGNSVTLDQCFRSFSRPERLDERNKWYCSTCKEQVRALKTIKLWTLPNIWWFI